MSADSMRDSLRAFVLGNGVGTFSRALVVRLLELVIDAASEVVEEGWESSVGIHNVACRIEADPDWSSVLIFSALHEYDAWVGVCPVETGLAHEDELEDRFTSPHWYFFHGDEGSRWKLSHQGAVRGHPVDEVLEDCLVIWIDDSKIVQAKASTVCFLAWATFAWVSFAWTVTS